MTEHELEREKTVLGTKVVLTLSVQQINGILAILGKYPFEEIQGIIGDIHRDCQPQVNKIIADLDARDKAAESASSNDVA